jgi:hypothetical protein
MPLHHGKLTQEAKTTVTEAMDEYIRALATKARCHPSDLIRDALYLQFTGNTYLDHVSNDRRQVIQRQGREMADAKADAGPDGR